MYIERNDPHSLGGDEGTHSNPGFDRTDSRFGRSTCHAWPLLQPWYGSYAAA